MRLISFAQTTVQFYWRRKRVTRRVGWWDVQPGELLCGVERCRGLAAGQSPRRIAIIRVVSTTVQRLAEGVYSSGGDECADEGFPHLFPHQFVEMFASTHKIRTCEPVNRIAFEFVPGGRFADYTLPAGLGVPGICSRCGCVELDACVDDAGQPCWWVDSAGHATLTQTSLCSHCFAGVGRGPASRDFRLAEMEVA